MYMSTPLLSSETPGEGIIGSYYSITDGCQPPCGCWELNSGPLEEHLWEAGAAAGPMKPTCLLPCLSMCNEAACVGCLPGWTVLRDGDLSAYL